MSLAAGVLAHLLDADVPPALLLLLRRVERPGGRGPVGTEPSSGQTAVYRNHLSAAVWTMFRTSDCNHFAFMDNV